MQKAFRHLLTVAAVAALSACAANPVAPARAPIDYRTMGPPAASTPPQAAAMRPPAPSPRIADLGVSPDGLSAVEEAKALPVQSGPRPGGPLRQPKPDASSRAITVKRGDSVSAISQRYSVNMRALIEANGLQPPYALDVGDVIYLPPVNVHVVQAGETLYSVSQRYAIDTRSLALLNGMPRPWLVWPGDELLLPPLARDQVKQSSEARVQVASPKAAAAKPAPRPAQTSVRTSDPVPLLASNSQPVRVADTPSGAHGFIWPVSGEVIKGFGMGQDGLRNDGVNIATQPGAEVKAAASGEVVYAGDELSGFGNLILIRHDGGWVSAYAHAEAMLVKEGDTVKQGQPIASAGATGNALQPQVHFELRKGREPVDPAEHLPALTG